MTKQNSSIKCEVNHCKHYNENYCSLKEIKVCKCDCGCDGDKENTLCGSYECRKG
jgi:hypothetical protein